MKRVLIIFSLIFYLLAMGLCQQAFASDQKLVHGAGTLPHLTSAVTLNIGGEFPTPIIYDLQYDIGLGNRVQLGLSATALLFWIYGSGNMFGIEVHSMFNVLKSDRDSDFLSLYLNPGIFIINDLFVALLGPSNLTFFFARPGIAYEHRFGDNRHIGLYVKVGTLLPVGVISNGEFVGGGLSVSELPIDIRVGLQALLGRRFSIALEPMLMWGPTFDQPYFGVKGALTWAF